jgi:hypothetical protein
VAVKVDWTAAHRSERFEGPPHGWPLIRRPAPTAAADRQ